MWKNLARPAIVALALTTASLSAQDTHRVFTGRVVQPGGAPAAGAVVVSNAGGRAVTSPDGTFALAVDVAPEAESVQVTAVSGAAIASARVATSEPSIRDDLVLAATTNCQPTWLPTFGAAPGTDLSVQCFAVFDDGSGPALHVGGAFTSSAGNAPARYVAKWDGTAWAALGSGPSGAVRALAVFDDGSGAALYAGTFPELMVSGGFAGRVDKWDGAAWSVVGTMTGSGAGTQVRALAAFDDGSGSALYAGGDFTGVDGMAASRIAKWNGTSWTALGTGVSETGAAVRALAVFDDGSGPALHVGGSFTTAGAITATGIAKWNGATWSPDGSGTNGIVDALAVCDDGSGPALFAGGLFSHTGTTQRRRLLRELEREVKRIARIRMPGSHALF